MGELYVCSHGLATMPYFIESIGLNVYSLEELCYYLKKNSDLADPSFMDDELVDWIKTELKLSSLAARLAKIKSSGEGLFAFVKAIASACSYCTDEELLQIEKNLADFGDKSEIECRKIRADRLLLKKRYGASILEYKKLIEVPGIGSVFLGDIYHNLGTAYAGLFFFGEAEKCYAKAYERNKNPRSLQQQKMAQQLEEGAVPHAAGDGGEPVPKEALGKWRDSYIRSCK